MIFSQEFEKVIEHLPETIMKNDVFIEAYGKREEIKMSKKEFFSKLVKELEKELSYDPKRVKEIIGEKYYKEACSFYANCVDGKVSEDEEPIPELDKTSEDAFKKYFTCSLRNMPLPVPEKYKNDFFEYVYIPGMFVRCINKIYKLFFYDVEKFYKYISKTINYTHDSMNLECNILNYLEKGIVINGAIEIDEIIHYSLARETCWILEKNINIDNYNIYMDVDEKNENAYLIRVNDTGCFEAKTKIRLTLEPELKKKSEYWENKVKDNKSQLSPYTNLTYQAKIALNEKMKSVLCGGGNFSSISSRLKYLGFLRNGLRDYEAFLIEKQSGFYLTYILMNGMLKNQLLQVKDLEQLETYRKTKSKIMEKHMAQLLSEDNVKTVLRKIKNDDEWYENGNLICTLPNRKTQLILIMFYLISAIHSVDANLFVATCVMWEIQSIQNFSEAYVEKMLLNIDNMLLGWIKEFNYQYDFLLEVMVYMYSYKKTDERLKYLKGSGTYPLGSYLTEIDNIMQKAYMGDYSAVANETSHQERSLVKKIFTGDSECTEQRIQSVINDYIVHGSYPEVFDFRK